MSAHYTVGQLARAAGTTLRTVRYYLERRVLPAAAPHGMHTQYTEEHLLRLRMIRRLREEERLGLEVIRARVRGMSIAEVAAFLEPPAVTMAVAPEAAIEAAPQAAVVTDAAPVGAAPAPSRDPIGGQAWSRIELLPGLELHVRGDASPVVLRLAREVRDQFAGGAG